MSALLTGCGNEVDETAAQDSLFEEETASDEPVDDNVIDLTDYSTYLKKILADVDFDGNMEVLITFTANHCGRDSLYIYKQDEERVFSLADTYATFREDVTWLSEGYGSLSPYLDIDLLDAYVNEDGEYRYLSLDYTLFGGFGELLLYVTTLEDDRPVKLAEIRFIENESSEEMEIFFQEERVYEPEELHELLEQYMTGYTKVEMEYKTLEVSFQRNIVAFNENEKRQCLEDLYESMEEYLDWKQDYLLSLVEPEEKRQTIQLFIYQRLASASTE